MLFEGQRLLAAVAVLLFMLWGRPALATEKWAVLVGVGDYIHGTQLDLDGPANDVQMIEELLLGKFGYRSEQIRKMVDAQATKANILAGLKWVRDQAKPGDVVLIYYSGHGSQAGERGLALRLAGDNFKVIKANLLCDTLNTLPLFTQPPESI